MHFGEIRMLFASHHPVDTYALRVEVNQYPFSLRPTKVKCPTGIMQASSACTSFSGICAFFIMNSSWISCKRFLFECRFYAEEKKHTPHRLQRAKPLEIFNTKWNNLGYPSAFWMPLGFCYPLSRAISFFRFVSAWDTRFGYCKNERTHIESDRVAAGMHFLIYKIQSLAIWAKTAHRVRFHE